MAEQEQTDRDERPEGWQQVDYDQLAPDIRPVVEARIGRLYGQVKEGQRVMTQLAEDNKTLLSRLSGIEQKLTVSQTDRIKEDLKAATADGDYDKVATLTEELVNATSKPADEPAPAEAKAKDETAAQESLDLSEHLSTEEEAFVAAWYQERDADGASMRPWADPKHEDFNAAADVFTSVWNRPSVRQNGVQAVLAEVDRVMGTQKPARQNAPVMRSTGQSSPSRGSTSKLTAEQRQAAQLLGVGEDVYQKEIANMQANEKAGEKAYRRTFDD